MKKATSICLLLVFLMQPQRAKADIWGADVGVLANILAETLLQLEQLRELYNTAESNLQFVKDINAGINDALRELQNFQPNSDPGLYGDWSTAKEASRRLRNIYGEVPDSNEAQVQRDTDQNVAEAIALNNDYYRYTKQMDDIGERFKKESQDASPGGAQKQTVQALGLMIQLLNQMLRAQATTMKLQAQTLALQNRKAKTDTGFFLANADALAHLLEMAPVRFEAPRF